MTAEPVALPHAHLAAPLTEAEGIRTAWRRSPLFALAVTSRESSVERRDDPMRQDSQRPLHPIDRDERPRIQLGDDAVQLEGVPQLRETLSNLDYKLRMAMRSEVKQIQKETGITALFVTHDQAEALTMSDRIVVLSRGRVMQIGEPMEIYEKPSNKFVADFIGEANFFDGTVVESRPEVGISLGSLVMYAAFRGTDLPRTGQSASFSVRPEKLRIHPRGVSRHDKRNVYDAVVEDHDYLGAVVRYYLRLGETLTVKVDETNASGVLYRAGDEVAVEIPPDDCFVLPVGD